MHRHVSCFRAQGNISMYDTFVVSFPNLNILRRNSSNFSFSHACIRIVGFLIFDLMLQAGQR